MGNYGPALPADFSGTNANGASTVCDDSGNCTVFDVAGNAVSTFNNNSLDWTPTPTGPDTPVDSGGGTDISNMSRFTGSLGNIFQAVGAAVGLATGKAVAPVCPGTLPCAAPNRPGYLYNPQTGQYTPATTGAGFNLTAGNGLLILAVLVFGVFILAKR